MIPSMSTPNGAKGIFSRDENIIEDQNAQKGDKFQNGDFYRLLFVRHCSDGSDMLYIDEFIRRQTGTKPPDVCSKRSSVYCKQVRIW